MFQFLTQSLMYISALMIKKLEFHKEGQANAQYILVSVAWRSQSLPIVIVADIKEAEQYSAG